MATDTGRDSRKGAVKKRSQRQFPQIGNRGTAMTDKTFKYLHFVLSDPKGEVQAVQPFVILDQDILVGARPHLGQWIDFIWNNFE